MNGKNPFHEHVLHWLWQHRFPEHHALATSQGDQVIIHHPGYPNKTDGPDFTNARITIGDLKWHGDVEIHWQASDWIKHHHQNDPSFNRVILHVTYDQTENTEVCRYDQTQVPTLSLEPFLKKPLQYFFARYQQQDMLPCVGNLSSIPFDIIKQQFEEAHRAYLETKVSDFLRFYDGSLPMSKAWKRALTIAIFDNLGITHNRTPMKKLARLLLEESRPDSVTNFINHALKTAGIKPKNTHNNFSWNSKGSRPANRPKNRIKQGCYMMNFIHKRAFNWWLKTNLKDSFQEMTHQINTSPALGNHQAGVLLGTVWLPAYYVLGDLTGNKGFTANAAEAWANHRSKLPNAINEMFLHSGMPKEAFHKKLGAVHQYREFCKPKRCQECKVFHGIISS